MDGAELRVICGPTAAGKSALALELAARAGAVILSADSRQVYRHFDVGTAKPGAAELARVQHRGIDLVEPTERYTAAAWATAARGWLAAAAAASTPMLVVGGTGFYVRALTAPLFEEPPLDAARRSALADILGALSTAELRRWCTALDPARAHLGRAQLHRAAEIALLTGRPLSTWHRCARPRASAVPARYLLLDPGPALGARIEARAAEMLNGGWPEEVEALRALVPDTAPAWAATGYRTVRSLVEGRLTHAAALERIIVETRQYAKRQRTWFRHQLAPELVTTLHPHRADAGAVAARWWVHGRQE